MRLESERAPICIHNPPPTCSLSSKQSVAESAPHSSANNLGGTQPAFFCVQLTRTTQKTATTLDFHALVLRGSIILCRYCFQQNLETATRVVRKGSTWAKKTSSSQTARYYSFASRRPAKNANGIPSHPDLSNENHMQTILPASSFPMCYKMQRRGRRGGIAKRGEHFFSLCSVSGIKLIGTFLRIILFNPHKNSRSEGILSPFYA